MQIKLMQRKYELTELSNENTHIMGGLSMQTTGSNKTHSVSVSCGNQQFY